MKIIRKAMLISIFLFLAMGCDVGATTRYNAFLMGDSVIDNYPHSANGLAYYMKKDNSFKVVCDYSLEGKTICGGMKAQTKKLIKQLKKYKGKKNVVVFSFGANDYFKKCKGNHFKIYEECIRLIRATDSKTKIVAIVPTHIYRVRNDKTIKTIFKYPVRTKFMKKNIIHIDSKDYLTVSDIKPDCLHFTNSGYKKTVKQIREVIR